MATTGPASGSVPSSSSAAAVAAASSTTTTPNSAMSTTSITSSSSSVADDIASSVTATAIPIAIPPTPNYSKRKYIAFWDSDGAGVDSWIGKITGPFQNVVASTTATATATATTTPSSTTTTTDDNNNNIKKEQEGTYLYDALCAVCTIYCTIYRYTDCLLTTME
jgi:hypothetical protein